MAHDAFNDEETSLDARFSERKRLMELSISKFGSSVLLHSVSKEDVFKKILLDKKLKLPSDNDLDKKTSLMESILGFNNCIYFSVGFVYSTAFNWKFGLMFSDDFVSKLTYYKNSINYQAYVKIVKFWLDNDREYLDSFMNHSTLCKEIILKHFDNFSGGKTNTLDFWKVETEFDLFIKNYSRKDVIQDIISNLKSVLLVSYPQSKKDASTVHAEERAPELMSFVDVSLENNPYFLGFHIVGDIPDDILEVLKRDYADKVVFDGWEFRDVDDL